MKAHEAIARALSDNGVAMLFGLIGDANLFMVDSYVRACGGTYVSAQHEAGAMLPRRRHRFRARGCDRRNRVAHLLDDIGDVE